MSDKEIIKTQNKLIEILETQVIDLTMMSKIELGDDVIAELKRLKDLLKSIGAEKPTTYYVLHNV